MKDVRHSLGIAVSLSAIGAILLLSTGEQTPVSQPTASDQLGVKPPEEGDLSWSSDEVAPFILSDQVVPPHRLLGLPNFYGRLVHVERVGPPGKMEYYTDPEEMRRVGFSVSTDEVKAMEIGRRQTYNLQFISDHSALIEVLGFRAGAHGDGKIEPLLFKKGLYPRDVWVFRESALID